MSRREAWITALAVFAIALAVRVVAASIISFPKPEDTAYYVGVARNLVEGWQGVRVGASCPTRCGASARRPLVFPRPAFEVWLPLPSLLAAIPIALTGAAAPDPARDGHARVARSCPWSRARWSPCSPGGSRRTWPPSARSPTDGRGPWRSAPA